MKRSTGSAEDAAVRRRGFPFRHRSTPGGLLPAVLCVAAAVLLVPGCGKDDETGEASGEEANAADPRTITAYGTVEASETREIVIPYDSGITDVPVWEGARVRKGDVLMVLDERDLRRAESEVRLDWEAADTLLKENISRLAALDVQVGEARAQTERLVRLNTGGSVSAQELESQQAELDALEHDRDAASWSVEGRRRDVEGKRLAYEAFRENVKAPHFNGHIVVSPYDSAVVAEVNYREGSEASAGALILVIDDTTSLRVEADLPEEFVREVVPGTEATVIPVADPDRSYPGVVSSLAGRAVIVNGETVVKIRIDLTDPDDDFLRAGFNVDVEIIP